ncbi:non-ribosomal peptide synthetase [Virgisporangium aurantiacum]|uniref:Carrier domain-containing protein n=1 Tax=Virgisporangium aurantiacum TaxID=175570 RepID=A0A8J3Z4V6_9ACTN|nr:non-ribosomal peptide synthetase [Virgisporangium aurantiacum]GIJ56358.1 hypothetical protein Vau01_038740 [Virgisporangium aurantiacum]
MDAPLPDAPNPEWTRGPGHDPPDVTVWDLVVARATERPDAEAVRQWESRLSYADLVGAASALAARIRAHGAGPGALVGVCVARTPLMPVAVLGVLASGAAYVVLDPAHPRRRLDDVLDDAGIAVVVADAPGAALLAGSGRTVLVPEPDDRAPTAGPPDPAGTAYVLYTSGSTGRPKGVQVGHRSVTAFVTAAGVHFGLDGDTRAIAFAALGFDVSVLDLLTPLTRGSSVRLVPDADRVDPARLQRFLEAHDVTWGFLPPALLPLADPTRLPHLRDLVTAGEPPGPEQVARWTATGTRFHNWYGPTETTVCVVGTELTGTWDRPVPIGRPLPGCTAYILDGDGAPCPPGIAGELHIGGPQVAVGYWRRPDLTAERFVTRPDGERLYRTGDRAAWEPDGRIAYLGRLDRQVKIQGQRVEIGEVEAVVRAHPGVLQAVVDAVDDGLTAYVTPAGAPDLAALREHCARRLPGYMLPTRVVRLAALPLTTAGKTDTTALRTVHDGRLAPVAAVWAEILDAPDPRPDDTFLDAGGHSLRAMRLVSALRQRLGRDVSVEDVHAGGTLDGLTRRVLAAPALPESHPVRAATPTLSTAQRRIWFVEQVSPGTSAHVVAFAHRIRGPLDVARLRGALATVVARHEPLRWRVPQRDGVPYVRVEPPGPVPLPVVDATEDGLDRFLDMAATTPFDLADGPLWRAAVARLGSADHVLVTGVHHIVFDGWSQDVFLRDLATAYTGVHSGPLVATFDTYVATLAARAARTGAADLAWWTDRLAGAPTVCDLPRDRPRPPAQTFRGLRRSTTLDPATTDAVRALARRCGATPHAVLLAVFGCLLRRLTGSTDLVVGVPYADREDAAFEPLVGLLLHILPVRLRIDDDEPVTVHIGRCAEEVRAAAARRAAPLDRVVEALRVPRDLGRNPLIQVLFNQHDDAAARLHLPGCAVTPVSAGLPGSLFDLTVYVGGDADRVQVVANPDLYDAARVEAFLASYVHLLQRLTAEPDAPVGAAAARPPFTVEAPVPPPARPVAARTARRVAAPAVSVPVPPPAGPVADRIARRAAATPDTVAVDGAGGPVTYRDLDRQRRRVAAGVAAGLAAAGIAPGATVAVLATRHTALPALLLGILTAGARWAVLDTAHPAPALAAQAVAADATALVATPDATVPADLAHLTRLSPMDGPDPARAPAGYLSFTSGTTGRPQVVVAPAEPLAAFLGHYPAAFGLGPGDRFAMLAGLAHDPLLRDVFTPLVLGATLVVPEQAWIRDPVRLHGFLAARGVTVAHVTPQLVRMLGTVPAAALPALRLVVSAGDHLTAADVARMRALAPNARLVNGYGTTETPQLHAWHEIESGGTQETVPVGRGVPGSTLTVVDAHGRPAAVGELGEVVVHSRNLATGYLDPRRTADRFPAPGTYRTGDLGRHRADGSVVLAGRADQQVKVRGHRVELAEIEAALAAHPDVRTAAAVPVETGGERAIRVFVAPAQPDLSVADLTDHLRRRFPEPAVPADIRLVPAIPLTANGKADRAGLAALAPPPVPGRAADDELRTRTERLVGGVWRSVLGRPRIGAEDNFFDAGGHSLALATVAARLSAALGAEIPIVELFNRPTIRSLAGYLDGATTRPGLDRAARRVAARRGAIHRDRARRGNLTTTEPTGDG